LYVLTGGDQPDFVVEEPPAFAGALLRRLDGTASLAELSTELAMAGFRMPSREVEATVAQLYELGLVEDAAGDDILTGYERERYDRQLRYFGDVAGPGEKRADLQARLRESTVAVIGLGGLGSWAAYALACCGVGRLDCVDGDRVELSNLNRQILYGDAELGEPKAEAAARRLRAFNPSLEIRPLAARLESVRDVEAAVGSADFVIDAADWPVHEIERWVNAACFKLGVPYITMSQSPPIARLGPTYVPGRTACFLCRERQYREQVSFFDELVDQRRSQPSPAATFGPACGLIGSHAALEAVHYIARSCPPATLGTALIVDLRTMQITREPLPSSARCGLCAAPPAS
jgi:bacteriocin biosynthesis cyclodehydratase domain-containing protein